jgi:hypothetical protein
MSTIHAEFAQTVPPEAAAKPARPGRFGPLVLALQVTTLLAAVGATIAGVVIGVPDTTDYGRASILKHDLLAMDAPRKIVLVGGSNLSFGVDSTIITEITGCPVVNMGMNGYFGARFMTEEVKPYLKPGDIVVMAWEYDNYYKTVDGAASDLLMVTKANPMTFGYLTMDQKLDVISQYPQVAQQKIVRVIGDLHQFTRDLRGRLSGAAEEAPADPHAFDGGYSGFDPATGDLHGHLNSVSLPEPADGADITAVPMDPGVLPLMRNFADELEAKGVNVMVSFTAVMDSYYRKHQPVLDRLNTDLHATFPQEVEGSVTDYMFAKPLHFDTVYHLNAEGRVIRSQRLAEDIVHHFGRPALCKAAG